MTVIIPLWALWLAGNLAALVLIAFALRAYLVRRSRLWFVGRMTGPNRFDVQGIFSRRARALAACTGRGYFLFPLPLNQAQPETATEPEGLEFPHREN